MPYKVRSINVLEKLSSPQQVILVLEFICHLSTLPIPSNFCSSIMVPNFADVVPRPHHIDLDSYVGQLC